MKPVSCWRAVIVATHNQTKQMLLVDRWRGGERVALAEAGKIKDLWLRPPRGLHHIGAIYRAHVTRRFNKQLAIVSLGKDGAEAQLFKQNGQIPDSLLVQITADSVQTTIDGKTNTLKMAECSAEIKLAGRYLIHLPIGKDVLVSRRLTPASLRDELRVRFRQWGADGGWIIRSSAAGIADDQLAYEAGYLSSRWRRLMEKKSQDDGDALLMASPHLAITAINDYGLRPPIDVVVTESIVAAEIRRWSAMAAPDLQDCLRIDKGVPGLFEMMDLETAIEDLHRPVVETADGCSMIFESTAAMHVVDVNAGRQSQRAAFVNNRAVTEEIARQVRLRGLSGIILIDYLKMSDENERHQLVDLCRDAFAADPVPTQVHGLSRLGLMEITRMRRWASFAENWAGFNAGAAVD